MVVVRDGGGGRVVVVVDSSKLAAASRRSFGTLGVMRPRLVAPGAEVTTTLSLPSPRLCTHSLANIFGGGRRQKGFPGVRDETESKQET